MENNMKDKFLISLFVIVIFGIGMLIGYIITNRYKSYPKIEKVEVEKLVGACDKAFGNNEKAMCVAKESCNGKIKDFKYDGWRGDTTFNCQ
jgi:uncharacterized membrane protein YciS (DUF1049 family)